MSNVANGPEPFDGELPPFFIYPVIILLTFLFSLGFFRAVSTNSKLTAGKLNTFSHRIFYDPLPFYHFVSLAGLTIGISAIFRAILLSTNIDPNSLVALSVGIGVYPSVLIANNKFIAEQNHATK